ncbi:hypothetical protein DXG01_002623 [Tephrocybe rancida]|nr:hypothetical protein DXG01_002623 [Tephrocybe rancida]
MVFHYLLMHPPFLAVIYSLLTMLIVGGTVKMHFGHRLALPAFLPEDALPFKLNKTSIIGPTLVVPSIPSPGPICKPYLPQLVRKQPRKLVLPINPDNSDGFSCPTLLVAPQSNEGPSPAIADVAAIIDSSNRAQTSDMPIPLPSISIREAAPLIHSGTQRGGRLSREALDNPSTIARGLPTFASQLPPLLDHPASQQSSLPTLCISSTPRSEDTRSETTSPRSPRTLTIEQYRQHKKSIKARRPPTSPLEAAPSEKRRLQQIADRSILDAEAFKPAPTFSIEPPGVLLPRSLSVLPPPIASLSLPDNPVDFVHPSSSLQASPLVSEACSSAPPLVSAPSSDAEVDHSPERSSNEPEWDKDLLLARYEQMELETDSKSGDVNTVDAEAAGADNDSGESGSSHQSVVIAPAIVSVACPDLPASEPPASATRVSLRGDMTATLFQEFEVQSSTIDFAVDSLEAFDEEPTPLSPSICRPPLAPGRRHSLSAAPPRELSDSQPEMSLPQRRMSAPMVLPTWVWIDKGKRKMTAVENVEYYREMHKRDCRDVVASSEPSPDHCEFDAILAERLQNQEYQSSWPPLVSFEEPSGLSPTIESQSRGIKDSTEQDPSDPQDLLDSDDEQFQTDRTIAISLEQVFRREQVKDDEGVVRRFLREDAEDGITYPQAPASSNSEGHCSELADNLCSSTDVDTTSPAPSHFVTEAKVADSEGVILQDPVTNPSSTAAANENGTTTGEDDIDVLPLPKVPTEPSSPSTTAVSSPQPLSNYPDPMRGGVWESSWAPRSHPLFPLRTALDQDTETQSVLIVHPGAELTDVDKYLPPMYPSVSIADTPDTAPFSRFSHSSTETAPGSLTMEDDVAAPCGFCGRASLCHCLVLTAPSEIGLRPTEKSNLEMENVDAPAMTRASGTPDVEMDIADIDPAYEWMDIEADVPQNLNTASRARPLGPSGDSLESMDMNADDKLPNSVAYRPHHPPSHEPSAFRTDTEQDLHVVDSGVGEEPTVAQIVGSASSISPNPIPAITCPCPPTTIVTEEGEPSNVAIPSVIITPLEKAGDEQRSFTGRLVDSLWSSEAVDNSAPSDGGDSTSKIINPGHVTQAILESVREPDLEALVAIFASNKSSFADQRITAIFSVEKQYTDVDKQANPIATRALRPLPRRARAASTAQPDAPNDKAQTVEAQPSTEDKEIRLITNTETVTSPLPSQVESEPRPIAPLPRRSVGTIPSHTTVHSFETPLTPDNYHTESESCIAEEVEDDEELQRELDQEMAKIKLFEILPKPIPRKKSSRRKNT